MVDLHPACRDQLTGLPPAAPEHGRQHRVQPQGRHGGTADLALRRRKLRHVIRFQKRRGQLGMPGLIQFTADQLRGRFQSEHIGCARLVGRQNDIAQRFSPQFKAHQAAQIVLVRRELCPRLCAAVQPHAANGGFGIAELRFKAKHPAFRVGPAAVKAETFADIGPPQRCAGKLLLPVTQKAGVPRNAAGKRCMCKVLDMPHQIALFIVARRDKSPHGSGFRINRTRHCSPARPAGRP